MAESNVDREEKNRKAQEILEAALGGEKLKADVQITTGDKLREELMERAKQKQRTAEVPSAIQNVSFAYQRSNLGSSFANKRKIEDAEAKRAKKKDISRSERLSKLGLKEDLTGKKAVDKSSLQGKKPKK